MFFKKKRTRLFLKEKRKPWMIVFPITSIFIAISVWGAIAFFIPDEINLMEGEEQSFRFHLPLQAEVQNDNINVLNVNNQAVTDNIHIDLNEPFTVKSENQGNAKVSLSLFGLVPVKTVSATVLPKTEVIPGGMAVGISMDTKGIMVLGTGFVTNAKNETSEPSKNILKSGDLILEVNKTSLDSKEDLIQELKKMVINPQISS